jgi:hypothetical protein
MELGIWIKAFEQSVKRGGDGALEWGLPEAWLHAELYSALKASSKSTGWLPFPTEVPYFTNCPVYPQKGFRGGVKWVDLCLQNSQSNEWCWFELKVRHVGLGDREHRAAISARDSLKKDVVGLMGLDVLKTQQTWLNPQPHVKSHIITTHLSDKATLLTDFKNHFVTAFLQLDSNNCDQKIWSEEVLRDQIHKWAAHRGLEKVKNFTYTQVPLRDSHLTLIYIA